MYNSVDVLEARDRVFEDTQKALHMLFGHCTGRHGLPAGWFFGAGGFACTSCHPPEHDVLDQSTDHRFLYAGVFDG